MCIVLPKFESDTKVADKDIIVYKVLVQRDDECIYRSPYQNFQYGPLEDIIGYTYRSELSECRWNVVYVRTVKGLYSYASYQLTRFLQHSVHIIGKQKSVVFRCVIPKGSRYYTNGKEYCSDQLKFIERVNPRC